MIDFLAATRPHSPPSIPSFYLGLESVDTPGYLPLVTLFSLDETLKNAPGQAAEKMAASMPLHACAITAV